MQTSKSSSKNGSSEMPQKTSPATPRAVRPFKKAGSDSPTSSPNLSSRTLKNRSPKVLERGSPRNTTIEKKRPKVPESETQLAQLHEELKKVKDQLNSTETAKKQAQKEAEETKKHFSSMSAKLEDSQKQMMELSASEEDRIQELRKISQERDRSWQSELEAIQRQHTMDSAALAAAMNEIKKLKKQLEKVAESEATQSRHAESAHAEIQSLRIELTETLVLVEKMKTQLNEYKESESHALEISNETQMQLEAAMATAETLRLEGVKMVEGYTSLSSELEQSKIQVSSLEKLVCKLQADLADNRADSPADVSGYAKEEKSGKLRTEIDSLKVEIDELKSALEASEARYQEEYVQSTLQIRNAYEEVERTRSESSCKEAELRLELDKAKATAEELKSDLLSKVTALQSISDEKNGLSMKAEENQTSIKFSEPDALELKKLEADLRDLRTELLDKKTQVQSITEENVMLRMEIQKREMESCKLNEEAVALAEAAKAAERDASMKLGYMTEEANKSGHKLLRVTEQLEAAQTVNTELESELRRLKVQSEQWRKAAEAAAAMLSADNGKFVDRTPSLDNNFHTISTKLDSPFPDDLDDDSPKKKNGGNMLKKFGVLWKKGQK